MPIVRWWLSAWHEGFIQMWWALGPSTLFLLSGGLKPAIRRHKARVLFSPVDDISILLKCPLGQISVFFMH